MVILHLPAHTFLGWSGIRSANIYHPIKIDYCLWSQVL